MKKLIITVLAVFYLGVSSGATVHFHYCMGELIEWGLSNDSSDGADDCSNCGMKKGVSEDCCQDQKQELKLKESQKAPLSTFKTKIFAIEPITYHVLKIKALRSFDEQAIFVNSIPRTGKTPVFILNRNFRI
ncbi:MAG: hypothetical protein HQ491_00960 [Bacteroidetes bacterium]|jgi:hypothetical protein|uniref:HYC_CC_PP family protein n=1 Tax=Daejeonella sp. TaxID=2805397 RepID=UPI00404A7620|nr:hypothetical protein [Bacteroidota bacterium]